MSTHTPFTITREDHGDGAGQLILTQDGVRVGALDYHDLTGGPIYIDFVEVSPSTRGTGLGKRLVEAAVAWARESKRKVVPVCSYSLAVIERDEALQDVLK
jgi:predicted GNAT family acetyltransferase